MNFFRSMFIEGDYNVSVGSVCVFVFLMAYTLCVMYAQYMGKPPVISAGEAAVLAGAIYALKKIPPVFKKENGDGI
jgi:hypothetical protein